MTSAQKMLVLSLLCFLTGSLRFVQSSHFRGGTITWRPLNTTPSGSTVQILIRQRYSWRRSVYYCDDNTIAAGGSIGDNIPVGCYSGSCSSYTTILYTAISCTDYNVNLDVSSGEVFYFYTLPLNVALSIGFQSGNWFANLAVGANGLWNIITRINTFLRPDGYINNSPVATTLPVIYKTINIQHIHVVQISDFDLDIIKCRWSIGSTSNINSCDECGSVCNGVPGAVLFSDNCSLLFTLPTAALYYAVAIQIEDYYNSNYTVPMSSVPLQFLFYGYTQPSGCQTPPAIIGNRPNRACIGVILPKNISELVIAQVNCPGKTIVDFISSSPIGLRKGSIMNVGVGVFQMTIEWTPVPNQVGPQGFCLAAVDDTAVPSDQWCITFLIGSASPDLEKPYTVQGSASPLGTVFANQTLFSIQATGDVNRPTRNGTFINITDADTNMTVHSIDCGWDPSVFYVGSTLVFQVIPPPWIPGHTYFVTFDSGVASGTDFCKPESTPITDRGYWRFDIWNPAISSTTTTTTTPPTIGTITTRPLLTTTVNTQLTTTGIVVQSTTTITTTSSTSTSSTSFTTTTFITTTVTTTQPPVVALYPKDLEKQCEQPVVIGTVLTMIMMVPVHLIGMFVAFTKFTTMFDPSRLNMQARLKLQQRRLYGT